MLLLILLLLALLGEPGELDLRPNELEADQRVTTADVEEFAARQLKRRRELPSHARELLSFVPPVDQSKILACGNAVLRYHNPKRGVDLLVIRRCSNYYCFWCPLIKHHKRTAYQAAKLQSISPENRLRVTNIVWTLPPPLQVLVREDPAAFGSWSLAVRRTIAKAYAYRAKHGVHLEDSCWNELGAIVNVHAIGDRSEPWPKWHPHMDMLLAAYRRVEGALAPMPEKWLEYYPHTANTYRHELRAAFKSIAKKHQDETLASFLRSDFAVDWRISHVEDTTRIIHEEKALHRVRYSCRPLFNMGQARLASADTARPILVYSTHMDEDRADAIHHVPARPAFGQLESIRDWLDGRKARMHWGILSKRAYANTVALLGREPIVERPKRGFVIKAAWARDSVNDAFTPVDPREVA